METTLVKLDIEGAKYDVIQDLLSNKISPKVITGEIEDYLRNDGIGLVNKLKSVGYKIKITGFGNEGNVCRQMIAILQ